MKFLKAGAIRVFLLMAAIGITHLQLAIGQEAGVGPHSKQSSKATPSPAELSAADTSFKAGIKLEEEKKYAEALVEFRKVAAVLPDDLSNLWNVAICTSLTKDYPGALALWKRLKALDPNNGVVRAKLIVVYQQMNNFTERGRERAELLKLRNSKKIPELTAKDNFCCDYFTAGGHDVYAYDFYELKGERALRYQFLVLKPEGTVDFKISLGSYKFDNDLGHEMGTLKPKERLYHRDGYYDSGRRHSTYGFYNSEPGYDEVKKQAIAVITGKQKQISGSTRP